MAWDKFLRACLIQTLFLPAAASALVVDIQGVRMEPEMVGASCVDIAGVYRGLRIEPDKPGQIPRICHSNTGLNAITIANATLVAVPPSKRDVVIRFEHEFPPGINGKIMARVKFQGFFASDNGVNIPSGDQLSLMAYFSQSRMRDMIADPLTIVVGDTVESAVFDYSAKKTYLAAGPRALKGELRVNFLGAGHKLTLPEHCIISLDSGSRFEDKMDTLEALENAEENAADDSADADTENKGGQYKPEAAPPANPGSGAPGLPPLPPLNPLPKFH